VLGYRLDLLHVERDGAPAACCKQFDLPRNNESEM
jgi:hypothetical protein